jgi:hypothetical protein
MGKKLFLQEVEIQDVINGLVENVENGDAATGTGRAIGRVEVGWGGRIYTLSIQATCDEDDLCFDDTLPVLDGEAFRSGRCVVRAPEGHYPSAVPYDAAAQEEE